MAADLLASLPWSTRLKIAVGAAKGLAFLHEAETPVIYRDFKASNILLDSVSFFHQLQPLFLHSHHQQLAHSIFAVKSSWPTSLITTEQFRMIKNCLIGCLVAVKLQIVYYHGNCILFANVSYLHASRANCTHVVNCSVSKLCFVKNCGN